jgi:hypothetical protein
MRRVYLRGHQNILKRVLLHARAMNLGLLMRSLFGLGSSRGLQGRLAAFVLVIGSFVPDSETRWLRLPHFCRLSTSTSDFNTCGKVGPIRFAQISTFATGC